MANHDVLPKFTFISCNTLMWERGGLSWEENQVGSRWPPTLLSSLFHQVAQRLVTHSFIQKLAGECSNCKWLTNEVKLEPNQVWFHTDYEPTELYHTTLVLYWIFLEIFLWDLRGYVGLFNYYYWGSRFPATGLSIMERLVMDSLQVTSHPCITSF